MKRQFAEFERHKESGLKRVENFAIITEVTTGVNEPGKVDEIIRQR